jgi:hypothetical protein
MGAEKKEEVVDLLDEIQRDKDFLHRKKGRQVAAPASYLARRSQT